MFPIVLYKNLETFSPFIDAVANECVEGLFHSSPGVGQLVDSETGVVGKLVPSVPIC